MNTQPISHLIGIDDTYLLSLPIGLTQEVSGFFVAYFEKDQKSALNGFRKILERLMKCLCMASGFSYDEVPESGRFSANIKKLEDSGTICLDIREYLKFWWWIASFGSHDQTTYSCNFDDHLKVCRRIASVVLDWYTRNFPTIHLSNENRSILHRYIEALAKHPLEKLVYPQSTNIRELLRKKNVLLLTGEPWTGKSAIASLLAHEHVNDGYIPILYHEGSHKIPLSMYNVRYNDQTKHWVNATAGLLNDVVCTHLMYGNSFVIILDDPFGHRNFKAVGPLTRLPLARWLKLSSESHVFGRIKVVITSTSAFLAEAKAERFLQSADPIARENIALLNEAASVSLTLSSYSSTELSSILQNVAESQGCMWAENAAAYTLVAEQIASFSCRFDSVYSFCRATRNTNNETTLIEKAIIHFKSHATVEESLQKLPDLVQRYLCVVLIGDAVRGLIADKEFYTVVEFEQVCKAANTLDCLNDTRYADLVSEWVENETACMSNGSTFPAFKHPEIMLAVEDWALHHHAAKVGNTMDKLAGWSTSVGDILLWESVPLSCRFARFLDQSMCEQIDKGLFRRPKGTVVEVDRILWSIIRNWYYVNGSRLEPCALGFLKRIKHDFHNFIKPLIRELAENWAELTDNVRLLILEFNWERDHPKANNDNVLSFMAAVFANYNLILAAAQAGSIASETCILHLNEFVNALLAQMDVPAFPSRPGDQVWDDPSLKPTGRETLDKLIALGIKRGALEDRSEMVESIRAKLSQVPVEGSTSPVATQRPAQPTQNPRNVPRRRPRR